VAAVDDITALGLAAARGDRAALSELIRQTQSDVWRYVAGLAGTGAADDLTQETYLRVLGALPGFEGRANIRSWLLAIARRVVIDRVRHDRARPRVAAALDGLDVVDASSDRSGDLQVEQLLAHLELDRREALVLTALMGFSYVEAAEICGCAVGTIRSRVSRARADLVVALAAV
jgi:RNA polymerase sigma-70 factor (ECF subfamily)